MATRGRSARRVASGLLVAAAVAGVVWMASAVTSSLVETYGTLVALDPVLVGLVLVIGLVGGGVFVAARRLAGLGGPGTGRLLAGGVLLSVAVGLAGGLLGYQQHTESREAMATACDGAVGGDLRRLALDSGEVVWTDVILGDEPPGPPALVHGTDRGTCVAQVNATPADVLAAAEALGWSRQDSRTVVSPSGVAVAVERSAGQPPDASVVTLTADRR